MPSVEDRIEALAAAMADGRSVDWDRELHRVADEAARRQLEQLRLVHRIADVHQESQPTVTVGSTTATAKFSPGQVLGGRYRIGGLLGRGGMGEVWQAFDLKLRVDVALKALLREGVHDERALGPLRREVRSAREVVSPNVCRIFDLEEVGGEELVSMEYIDGETLLEVLRDRGPLEFREATEIAEQFLAGLAAIHESGLIHRDVKLENIMLTRSGRVVLMDFGLAKACTGRADSVAGTLGYMPPEQLAGQPLDPRADLFAAGVVLAEMISAQGVRDRRSRESLHRGIREEPPRLPAGPWRPALERAVARRPAARHASARELIRALEEVALRVGGAEGARPYPGLAAFTAEDAQYFYGRELEIESMWKRLQRPHLLALIGPSGAGKSSFLHAGLLPTMPPGWRAVICSPGSRPFRELAQRLVPEFAGDVEATSALLRFEELDSAVALVSRWRLQHENALIVVDQFEELFTLNPPETTAAFAELLGRLAMEADAHVLLSMRDDFLFQCADLPALTPIFSELTPLRRPTIDSLRRAVVQPALKCGFRFEDERLVDEVLAEVEDERGTLPLLAFAAARLWERRDRDRGLLPRAAYAEIGGVSGALAQHAESTMERIGPPRTAVVRELFRNLVTGQGTRATRDRQELLSVFATAERPAVERVLRVLIDSRLLTSYELPAGDDEEASHQRIEIVHESLLAAWPRLVRWQAQDADGALLRDQLRRAARLWKERDRSDDLLWSGTAFREYQVWRARYPGGLSDTEESFARAMTDRARRRTRYRRAAVAATITVLAAISGVVSVLWQQSARAERAALLEARRAEAAHLLSLARLELDSSPTVTVAHALRSLELADSGTARQLVLEALWRGPTAIQFTGSQGWKAAFTPDGSRLFASVDQPPQIRVWAPSGGDAQSALDLPEPGRGAFPENGFAFAPRADRFATYPVVHGDTVTLWSIPELERVRQLQVGGAPRAFFAPDGERLIVVEKAANGFVWRSWPLDGAAPTPPVRLDVATTEFVPNFREACALDPSGRWVAYAVGRELYLAPLEDLGRTPARKIGHHDESIYAVTFDSTGRLVAATEQSGRVRVWTRDGQLVRSLSGHAFFRHRFGAGGSMLVNNTARGFELWDLTAPPEADPIELLPPRKASQFNAANFHPAGRWLATMNGAGYLWPLSRKYPRTLRAHTNAVLALAVAPDGDYAVSASFDGTIRYWPLSPTSHERGRVIYSSDSATDQAYFLAAIPGTRRVLSGHKTGALRLISLDGGSVRELDQAEMRADQNSAGPAIDRHGRYAAWFAEGAIRLWNALTDETRDLGPVADEPPTVTELISLPDGRLLIAAGGHVRRWNPTDGSSESLLESTGHKFVRFDVDETGRFLIVCRFNLGQPAGVATFHDLQTGESRELSAHGDGIYAVALDPSGERAITASAEGVVRVGPVDGTPPHLMLGHDGMVWALRVTPDGRWIVSAGKDGTVRLWPMPRGDPFHLLPHDELLDRLRTLTNLRVVADPGSPTGYGLETTRFAGWEHPPVW